MWDMGAAPPLDDGLAWCGTPCNLLMTGWNVAIARVAAVVYGGETGRQSLITGNFVGIQRVDALQHIDGIMEEDYESHRSLVMTSGLATTGMAPNMIWTYSASEVLSYEPNVDAYFAQHLLFRGFPFAPVLGNDHSIQPAMDPTGAVQAHYAAWAPLFAAAVGGCWWLAAEPLRVEAAAGGLTAEGLQLNAFTVGGGCTDVATLGGTGPVLQVVLVAVAAGFASEPGDAVTLSIADAFEVAAPAACESAVPGGAAWAPIAPPTRDARSGRWRFAAAVALARGAAVVRCSRAAA
jgi:hypothetical protein